MQATDAAAPDLYTRFLNLRSERNLRPGLDPEHFGRVAGCTARRRVPAGQGIRWEDLLDRG